MIYIDKTPNPSGAYPNPKNQPFPGCIALNDEQAAVFFEYNGFVVVTVDPVTVTPNAEAQKAYFDAHPIVDTSVAEKIAELKEQLAATDYKVIKCSEAQLAGAEMPYDVTDLHATRQALRDEINELEGGVS